VCVSVCVNGGQKKKQSINVAQRILLHTKGTQKGERGERKEKGGKGEEETGTGSIANRS